MSSYITKEGINVFLVWWFMDVCMRSRIEGQSLQVAKKQSLEDCKNNNNISTLETKPDIREVQIPGRMRRILEAFLFFNKYYFFKKIS